MLVIELIRAFKEVRGLRNKIGPGSIGLLAYVVRAWHWARAHGLGPRPVPALPSIMSYRDLPAQAFSHEQN